MVQRNLRLLCISLLLMFPCKSRAGILETVFTIGLFSIVGRALWVGGNYLNDLNKEKNGDLGATIRVAAWHAPSAQATAQVGGAQVGFSIGKSYLGMFDRQVIRLIDAIRGN